jgi:hypothetical protein
VFHHAFYRSNNPRDIRLTTAPLYALIFKV